MSRSSLLFPVTEVGKVVRSWIKTWIDVTPIISNCLGQVAAGSAKNTPLLMNFQYADLISLKSIFFSTLKGQFMKNYQGSFDLVQGVH